MGGRGDRISDKILIATNMRVVLLIPFEIFQAIVKVSLNVSIRKLTATPNEAYPEIVYNPNPATNRQYQTTVVYHCPVNQSLPGIIKSNFSFNYIESFGMVTNVTAICRVDG